MALKLEQYHDLIEQYEDQFQRSPFLYKGKLFFLAVGGYAFLFLVLLINIGILAALIWWHSSGGPIVWISIGYGAFGLLLFSTVRSLLVRLPLPSGVEINRKDFPLPFQMVDSLRKPLKLRHRKIRILIDWEYNAYAFSRPMFGIFGPARHYLGIGLPLIASLNEPQVKAMIAHELAHFSRKHSRFSSWTGRLRMIWIDLLTRLEKRRITGFPYRAFATWYSRYFEASTVVLMRQDEIEADALAASAINERTVAQVLMRIALRTETVVDEYWAEIWRNALVSDKPSHKVVSRLLFRLGEPLDRQTALEELRWRLGDATEPTDTHPSLSDRLRSLRIDVPETDTETANFLDEWSITRGDSSISIFLGSHKKGSEVFLDAVWEVVSYPAWRLVHLEAKPITAMMVELDKEWKEKGKLGIEKAWKRADITVQYFGAKKALPIFDYILEQDEFHPHANFMKGCLLLKERDAIGILHIENAMEKDPLSYQEAGLATLSDYYRRMGSAHDFREARHESFTAAEETIKAIEERKKKIALRDTFAEHDLEEDQTADLRECFEAIKGIRKIYLVTREVEYLPGSRDYVFGIVYRWWGKFTINQTSAQLGQRFAFSRGFHPVILTTTKFFLRRKIARVENSLIYKAPLFRRKPKSSSE